MLTGTLVTVSGFLPIALAKSATGEYTRSIFEVSAIALLLSWLAAVIVIPLLGYQILSEHPTRRASLPDAGVPRAARSGAHDFTTPILSPPARLDRLVRRSPRTGAGRDAGTVRGRSCGIHAGAAAFFPSSDRPELLIDLRLPEGASFAATLRETQRFESTLAKRPEIDHFIDFVGAGAPRFYLPLDQQLAAPNFAQFVVTAKSVKDRENSRGPQPHVLATDYSSLRTRISRLENGPPIGFPVQFRVSGPEIGTVRQLSEEVAKVMRANADTDQCAVRLG